MSETIVIVDDERDLVTTLAYNLQREGFVTRTAYTGREGVDAALASPEPSLVLLDLMLPDVSGTEVCRQIRQRKPHLPIIILTAKGEEIDRVVGFELGADDYVVKPFSVRELMLRVKAILRRGQADSQPPPAGEMTFGKLRVDPSAHRVWVDGDEVVLTALEFRLLTTLLDRRGRVQTRNTLLGDVWGIRAEVTTRTVDTHVKRLRQKLGEAGNYVETLRGVGYRWRERPEIASA
ncbi:MAG: response regulator transcription factor [Deltaproteobacteria bacterium]|nr:response regulator transcription factor [Deltaproteobacteria bacterium]